MPRISYFFGIEIKMYHREHGAPHFHVYYQEQSAVVSIDELRVIGGKLKPRVFGLVMEWAAQHQDKLGINWERAMKKETLSPIDPLE